MKTVRVLTRAAALSVVLLMLTHTKPVRAEAVNPVSVGVAVVAGIASYEVWRRVGLGKTAAAVMGFATAQFVGLWVWDGADSDVVLGSKMRGQLIGGSVVIALPFLDGGAK